MELLYTALVVAVILVAVYIEVRLRKHVAPVISIPPPPPLTLSHLQPIVNELRDLKTKIEGSSVVSTVAKRIEDLHEVVREQNRRWDRDDEKRTDSPKKDG